MVVMCSYFGILLSKLHLGCFLASVGALNLSCLLDFSMGWGSAFACHFQHLTSLRFHLATCEQLFFLNQGFIGRAVVSLLVLQAGFF